jgi:osmotically-inducible protein OsmY
MATAHRCEQVNKCDSNGVGERANQCPKLCTPRSVGPRGMGRGSAGRLLLALCLGAAALTGCVPLVLGGALIGGSLVVTDRRPAGIQIEDEAIEIRAAGKVRDLATLGQVSVTSFNRMVLITGEVPAAAERAAVEKAVMQVENVRSVVNDLTLAGNSRVGARAGDALLSTKVKASLLDASDLQANAYKVVAERGVIYLLGRVTEREAARGVEVARAVPGVEKVVRVFEILSEDEISRMGRAGAGARSAAEPKAGADAGGSAAKPAAGSAAAAGAATPSPASASPSGGAQVTPLRP